MKIYTSYYAKMRKFPNNIMPISITNYCPKWYKGKEYNLLAPKKNFLINENTKLKVMNSKDVALLCYEKSSDFCHRHLVAQWISKNTDYEVHELEL